MVRLNWENYSKLKTPVIPPFMRLPAGTTVHVIDEYTVRFTFAEPDGMALPKFRFFQMVAPEYFTKSRFGELKWAMFDGPGPWGTGPFRLAEGILDFFKPCDRVVLDANEAYWDTRYPKVRTLVFDQSLAAAGTMP